MLNQCSVTEVNKNMKLRIKTSLIVALRKALPVIALVLSTGFLYAQPPGANSPDGEPDGTPPGGEQKAPPPGGQPGGPPPGGQPGGPPPGGKG